jgi:poly-beta-1,6-N-acetyl-D-glucosamine biosynthesis protein PgaD
MMIESTQKKKRVIAHVISGLMWLVIILLNGVLFTPAFNFITSFNHIAFLHFVLPLTIVFIIVIAILSYGWGFYNKKRFGKLNRRTMPDEVTLEDLEEAIPERNETLMELQSQKWTNIG